MTVFGPSLDWILVGVDLDLGKAGSRYLMVSYVSPESDDDRPSTYPSHPLRSIKPGFFLANVLIIDHKHSVFA